jgi:hypothetical protein
MLILTLPKLVILRSNMCKYQSRKGIVVTHITQLRSHLLISGKISPI